VRFGRTPDPSSWQELARRFRTFKRADLTSLFSGNETLCTCDLQDVWTSNAPEERDGKTLLSVVMESTLDNAATAILSECKSCYSTKLTVTKRKIFDQSSWHEI